MPSPSDGNGDGASATSIWIAASLTVCLSTLGLIARAFAKHRHRFDGSDGAILVAQMLVLGRFGALACALEQGLGKPLEDLDVRQRHKVAIVSLPSLCFLFFFFFPLALAAKACRLRTKKPLRSRNLY